MQSPWWSVFGMVPQAGWTGRNHATWKSLLNSSGRIADFRKQRNRKSREPLVDRPHDLQILYVVRRFGQRQIGLVFALSFLV
jgi:hypothetical protein